MSVSQRASLIALARPILGDEEKAAVLRVLDSGQLAEGAQVAALEAAFCDLIGVRHSVAVSSGTAALHLALLAHGIGPGDEVITSAFTFIATVNSILLAGAKPVFADVDPATFNIDPRAVEAAITPRTSAIMPVHLYGQPADMIAISQIADRHQLLLLEDAAQAIGATVGERMVGGFGTGSFSLYPTKNVTSGEGGMITTNDERAATRARMLRSHGMRARYQYEMLGYNYRMTDIAAAIGLVQLRRLPDFTGRRRRNAAFLNRQLRSVVTPHATGGTGHVWHQYTVRVRDGRDRDSAVERLKAAGIGTGIFYPAGVHQFDHVRAAAGDSSLPETEALAREVFSLPVHPGLSPEDLDRIVEAVNAL